jgi:hypothetical protein
MADLPGNKNKANGEEGDGGFWVLSGGEILRDQGKKAKESIRSAVGVSFNLKYGATPSFMAVSLIAAFSHWLF